MLIEFKLHNSDQFDWTQQYFNLVDNFVEWKSRCKNELCITVETLMHLYKRVVMLVWASILQT